MVDNKVKLKKSIPAAPVQHPEGGLLSNSAQPPVNDSAFKGTKAENPGTIPRFGDRGRPVK